MRIAWTNAGVVSIIFGTALLLQTFVVRAVAGEVPDIKCKDYRFLAKAERFSICKKEAEEGHAQAQLMLGYMYEFGEQVAKDKELGHHWFALAAAQQNAEAMSNIADDLFYKMQDDFTMTGKQADPADVARMVDLWTRAAEKGYEPAQYQIGVWYEQGPHPDLVKAYMYYEMSSRNGGAVSDELKHELASQLTPEEIKEAERRAQELISLQKSQAGSQ